MSESPPDHWVMNLMPIFHRQGKNIGSCMCTSHMLKYLTLNSLKQQSVCHIATSIANISKFNKSYPHIYSPVGFYVVYTGWNPHWCCGVHVLSWNSPEVIWKKRWSTNWHWQCDEDVLGFSQSTSHIWFML